jgi:cobalt-zinc-cadmium efflux system membrane fusion protein
MKNLFFSTLTLLLLTLLSTCDRAQKHQEGDGHDHDAPKKEMAADDHDEGHDDQGAEDDHDDHGDEGIHLTIEQIETMDIKFGDFSQLKVNDYLSATATLGLPPNAYAAVSARAAGFIRNARNYVEGDYVKRGAVIAYLENPEFIEHQRQYLETAAELVFLRQELDRQETLVNNDAGILREVQRLRSQVAAKTANVKGIQQRLQYLGIKTDDLTPDNITQRITLFSPRSGFITSISLHDGMYVEPSTQLMEVIDEQHLHLELDVFERDIAKLEKGQRVTYQIPALGNQRYEAEVHVIGKEFNSENKTVRVHAHLKGDQPKFIRDLFAEARIWLTDQTVQALPEAAVLREGEGFYVFIAPTQRSGDEVEFEKLMVKPGATDEGFTAVKLLNPLPKGMQIVTEGAYYVYAQGQAGALEHEH